MNLLQRASDCFKAARKNLLRGAALLYEIDQTKEWEEAYSTFGEYVEQECQISPSFAAKLLQVHGYFIEQHEFKGERLEGVDMEKLYMAIRLKGTPQKQLAAAQTLSRHELRQELAMNGTEECLHEHKITICAKCGSRV